jgi:hypothetical protein
MAMSETYRNAIANAGGALITHIGLVNSSGVEISGGGYARQAVTWTTASDGIIRPTADLVSLPGLQLVVGEVFQHRRPEPITAEQT